MRMSDLRTGWEGLSGKAKLMALGTVVLIGASLCLSFDGGNLPEDLGERRAPKSSSYTVEEGVEIPRGADPIPVASEDTQLVTQLVEALSHEDRVWLSAEDEVCWLEFTEEGFTAFRGDIAETAVFEIYTIEALENDREGTWRVTYEGGRTYDASFQFAQNREAGTYSLTSSALPMKTYLCQAAASEDVLTW